MAWWDGLAAAAVLDVLERLGVGRDDVPALAMRDPDCRRRAELLGVELFDSHDEMYLPNRDELLPLSIVPDDVEGLFDELVREWVLAPAAPLPENDGLPALPRGLNDYAHGTIEKAVRAFERDASVNQVEMDPRLKPHDGTRIRNLFAGGLFRLSVDNKLVVDPRVAGLPKGRIALRYLDARRERWLDPQKAPPPPA